MFTVFCLKLHCVCRLKLACNKLQMLAVECHLQSRCSKMALNPYCEHNFWFVFPTFLDMFLEVEIERCEQGSNLRENLFRFQVQLRNHSAITPRGKYVYSSVWWIFFASADSLMLELLFDFLLGIVLLVVSKRCNLYVFLNKWKWELLVRQSLMFGGHASTESFKVAGVVRGRTGTYCLTAGTTI